MNFMLQICWILSLILVLLICDISYVIIGFMIANGNKIALEIKEELKNKVSALGRAPKLALVQVGHDPASTKFVEKKREFGEYIGVGVDILKLPEDISAEVLSGEMTGLVKDPDTDGIVLQLPLPPALDSQVFLDILIPEKDPDALSNAPKVLPPVAGAVAEIFKRHNVATRGKKAVVIGRGRLVGAPIAAWLKEQGAEVSMFGRDTTDLSSHTMEADIIVTGTGVAGLVIPDMVRQGAILIDGGTSESATLDGQAKILTGDIDPACADKALLYTPVPGGVGPVTVAKLFENLVLLAEK